MHITRDQIIQLLRGRGDDDTAEAVEDNLPEQVDTTADADTLTRLGIEPEDLLGGGGDAGGGLAGKVGL